MGWIVLAILAYLTLVHSLWFAPLLLMAGFFKYYRWNRYKSRPWRRVHYQMMKVHAMAAGIEMNEAEKEGRDFKFEKSLIRMVELSGVNFETSAETIVVNEFQACEDFEDENILREWMKSTGDSSVTQESVNSVIDNYRSVFSSDNRDLMIRMIVAAVIEKLHTKSDRAEYLFEVINGKAT